MKKQVKAANPMFGYKVAVNAFCINSEGPDEMYGPWSSSWICAINQKIAKCTGSEHPDIVSSLDIPRGSNA